MVTIRSVNEIILNLIDFFRLAQPDLDTKPGTVGRDLFIDAPASQLALLYDVAGGIANKQSFRLVVGSDLDKLAKNFGVVRKQATPSTGVALLTFSSIVVPLNINIGATMTASNGLSFTVKTGIAVSPASTNFYRSVATKFRDQLDFVGITDQYAVEVTVVSSSPGIASNIGKYALSRTNISGVSNVTNINSFSGGTDQETDVAFRNRVLSSFSGSSVGTALGYLNVALGSDGVADAVVIEPGDPLMTRDGTIVRENSDGSRTIISEGSGGKVDIAVLGSILIQNADSFIFRDKSNNDPTNSKNNVVIGQIAGDENKTVNRKRIDNIANGQLPSQPVQEILSVTGSISGSNFRPKITDSLGRVSGNYELLKDTGVYGGSPWGFDTFAWVSDRISLFEEDRIKGQLNGQDATTFTDVLEIPTIQQSLSITNENSQVTSDRSIIRLLHTPITNVTRVFNVNTGERYVITNQNLDATTPFNSTGRIKISGNTLPSPSDTLQVDYSWIVYYDQYSDFDGLQKTFNPRTVTDSIDWGYGSAVKNEKIKFELSTGNNYFVGAASHPINSVITASTFTEVDAVVATVTSGTFINKLSVNISTLEIPTVTVDSIKFKNSNTELYDTAQANGSFTNASQIVGIEVLYTTTIILPNDTSAVAGDHVTVIINKTDVFTSDSDVGSSSDTQITIPTSLIDTAATELILDVTYIAAVSDLFSAAITGLPTSRGGNGYLLLNNNGFNNFSPTNISRRENQLVQQNLSNQFYVQLSITNLDFDLVADDILSIIRLVDGVELWNSDHPGTIAIAGDNSYQLILSELNGPVVADRVLVIYYADDIRRFQPFSFSNEIISTRIDTLTVDGVTGKFTLPLNNITDQASDVSFTIIEPNTDIVLFTVTDGYITADDSTALITSVSQNFNTLADILNKKLKITASDDPNNNGTYDILDYDSATNEITISNVLDKITVDQVSVVRILDGQEIFKYTGTIDAENNRILFPVTANAAENDKVFVMFFNFHNLRKSPTRIIGALSDQVVNPGVVTFSGLSLNKSQDIIFTATNTGLRLNIAEAVRKALSINSSVAIPSTIKLVKVIKLEKVLTASSSNDEVLSVLTSYDTKNTTVQNNLLFADEMLSNSELGNLDFILPSTSNNTLNTDIQNLPKIGDKLRITFYYTVDNDSENLSYTGNGALYTNKKFALINKIFVSSGFKVSQATRFTATSFTQPSLGARYKIFYDYIAPKQNERIVVSYNYNKIISDVTFSVENTRPINADVLVRAAKRTLVDLTINVVIADTFKSSQDTVLQNLKDQMVSTLTTNLLGGIIDSVTIINVAQSVNGIARARILYFNKTGASGQVLKLQAQEDEFFVSNNIIINTETR